MTADSTIRFVLADDHHQARIAASWSEMVAWHMHIADGFSLLAMEQEIPVGLIAVQWRDLPPPYPPAALEGFIDIIEVRPAFRRQGIATALIERAAERGGAQGAYQLRAWSSTDKTEALLMWKVLGFALCPAVTFPRGQEVHGYFVAKVLPSA